MSRRDEMKHGAVAPAELAGQEDRERLQGKEDPVSLAEEFRRRGMADQDPEDLRRAAAFFTRAGRPSDAAAAEAWAGFFSGADKLEAADLLSDTEDPAAVKESIRLYQELIEVAAADEDEVRVLTQKLKVARTKREGLQLPGVGNGA